MSKMLQTDNAIEFDSEHRCPKCNSYLRHTVQVVANHLRIKVRCLKCGEIETSLTSLGWITERIFERSLKDIAPKPSSPLTRGAQA